MKFHYLNTQNNLYVARDLMIAKRPEIYYKPKTSYNQIYIMYIHNTHIHM